MIMKVMKMTKNNEFSHSDDYCSQDSRITKMEEQLKTVFHNQNTFEKTMEKLDETQDKLAVSIAELNNTFKVLKVIGGILVTLFGGIAVFLIVELIKIIH